MTRDHDRFAPGAFHWCVDRVDVGEPTISRLVRVICRDQSIWPEQLLGRAGAGAAVSRPEAPPVATGHSPGPRIEARFVIGRRFLWRASYELTELAIENIAALTGNLSVGTVRPWARSWLPFERAYDRWEQHHDGEFNWWRRFAPHWMDLLGVVIPAEYSEWLGEPYRGHTYDEAAV